MRIKKVFCNTLGINLQADGQDYRVRCKVQSAHWFKDRAESALIIKNRQAPGKLNLD